MLLGLGLSDIFHEDGDKMKCKLLFELLGCFHEKTEYLLIVLFLYVQVDGVCSHECCCAETDVLLQIAVLLISPPSQCLESTESTFFVH